MSKFFLATLWIISTTFFLSSCRSTHKNNTPSNHTESKKLAASFISYEWFEGKCNTTYSGGFDELNFTANIRIHYQKVIWLSLTGPLSIEGGRALITPDSVQVVDRVNKKYYSGTYTSFCAKYNLPISFTVLQELIVGNVLNENTIRLPSKIDSDTKIYEENTKEFNKSVYINLKNYTVEKFSLKDRLTQRELLLNFADYTENKGKLFAINRKIEINTYHEKSIVQMEFNKFDFGKKLDFPFTIPENYALSPL